MWRGLKLTDFGLLAAALLLGVVSCGKKTNAVLCTVTYGGEAQQLEFPATSNPYGVKAVDVAGRFRFKAIYIREPWSAASINVYAYAQRRAGVGDALLQEGKYTPPFSPGAGARYGFTGRQLVYSPEQRELEYWCELSR
jgi:hypothetical protein